MSPQNVVWFHKTCIWAYFWPTWVFLPCFEPYESHWPNFEPIIAHVGWGTSSVVERSLIMREVRGLIPEAVKSPLLDPGYWKVVGVTPGRQPEYAKSILALPDILSSELPVLRRTFWIIAGHLSIKSLANIKLFVGDPFLIYSRWTTCPARSNPFAGHLSNFVGHVRWVQRISRTLETTCNKCIVVRHR